MATLHLLLRKLRVYEPDIVDQIEKEVLETRGVMTGAHREVYGFSNYEDFVKHITWCLFILNNRRPEIFSYDLDFYPSPGLIDKSSNFIDVIKNE